MCPEIFHCTEYIFFIILDFFSATCACPEKQSVPWNFSLYWIYVLHSGFLSNLRLPWKTECALISLIACVFCIIQDFWATCACPENFTVLKYFLSFKNIELLLSWKQEFALKIFTGLKYFLSFRRLALKTEFALKVFKPGSGSPLRPSPRTPMGLWHRGWKHYFILLGKWKFQNGMNKSCDHWIDCACLVHKIFGYYYYKDGGYVQVMRSTSRRYFRGRQYGPAWKCLYPKNKPAKNARNGGNWTKRTSERHERALISKKRSLSHLFLRRM